MFLNHRYFLQVARFDTVSTKASGSVSATPSSISVCDSLDDYIWLNATSFQSVASITTSAEITPIASSLMPASFTNSADQGSSSSFSSTLAPLTTQSTEAKCVKVLLTGGLPRTDHGAGQRHLHRLRLLQLFPVHLLALVLLYEL